jgi:hypothetical protein
MSKGSKEREFVAARPCPAFPLWGHELRYAAGGDLSAKRRCPCTPVVKRRDESKRRPSFTTEGNRRRMGNCVAPARGHWIRPAAGYGGPYHDPVGISVRPQIFSPTTGWASKSSSVWSAGDGRDPPGTLNPRAGNERQGRTDAELGGCEAALGPASAGASRRQNLAGGAGTARPSGSGSPGGPGAGPGIPSAFSRADRQAPAHDRELDLTEAKAS